jgi:hypothetical protein
MLAEDGKIPENLQELIITQAQKWCVEQFELIKSRTGLSTDFELAISPDVNAGYDIVILAGITPRILISELCVLTLFMHDTQYGFREKIRKTFDQLKRVTLSLKRPVARFPVVAMRSDEKEFREARRHEALTEINSRVFEYDFVHTVTVTDRITGTSVQITDKSLEAAKGRATSRLRRLILDDLSLAEQHERQQLKEHEVETKNTPTGLGIKITDIQNSTLAVGVLYRDVEHREIIADKSVVEEAPKVRAEFIKKKSPTQKINKIIITVK